MVVAATLDDSTERIIAYLTERGIPINALLFQVFAYGAEQLISRAWLIDPIRAQVSSATTPGDPSEPWNGEFYSSFGHGQSRSWEDAVEHGFICAGGGSWYSRTLRLLGPGDRVWVRVPGSGFVGVGRATGRVQSGRFGRDQNPCTPPGRTRLAKPRGHAPRRRCRRSRTRSGR